MFPRQKPLIERLYDRLSGRDQNGDDTDGIGSGARAISSLATLIDNAQAVLGNSGVLHMPLTGDIR